MAAVDVEIGGLTEDDIVRSYVFAFDEVEHAVAVAVLLHHRRGKVEGHCLGPASVGEDPGAVGHGGDRRQFVDRTAAPDLAVLVLAFEGVEVPWRAVADADAVDVAVHEDLDRSVADPGDHRSETVEVGLVETERLVLGEDPAAAGLLLPALGRDGDHVAEKTNDLVFVASGRGEGDGAVIGGHD